MWSVRRSLPAAVAVAVVTAGSAAANAGIVVRVDDDASGGGDGLSWATAFRCLQDALDGAVSGTEIRVAAGTYKPDADEAGNVTPGDRTAAYQLANGVSVRGGYAGIGAVDPDERDIGLYQTVLSGEIGLETGADNSYHVTIGSGTDGTAVLDGFTITGARANGAGEPVFHDRGGGMTNLGGSPSVINCTFDGNEASVYGGGMSNRDGSNPTVIGCTFADSSADVDGGGMYNESSDPTVTDCLFVNNVAGFGGGMYSTGSSPTLSHCTFIGNQAVRGGGMYVLFSSAPVTVTSCGFGANTAIDSGGGMINDLAELAVVNCLFNGNTASRGAAIMNLNGTSPTVINCTFADNTATMGGGAMRNEFLSDPVLTNCILWSNAPGHFDGGGTPTVTYSDVQGGFAGAGNIDAAPVFVNAGAGDLRLAAGSPCIDVGDTGAPTEDSDLDGNPRFVDDHDARDAGLGECPIVDMGAYEFQEGTTSCCPWDCGDGDGTVGIQDFLAVLGQWGQLGASCDLDGNGVGIEEFLGVLGNWGSCP